LRLVTWTRALGLLAGLSPLIFDHLNFNGRYFFPRPELDELRPLRNPNTEDDDL
jgi:hypothetical protein